MKMPHSPVLYASAIGMMLSLISCSEQKPAEPRTKSVPMPQSSQEELPSVPAEPAAEEPPAAPAGTNVEPTLITPPGFPAGGTNPTVGIAPPPLDPSQVGRPAVIPDPAFTPPTAPDAAVILPPDGAPSIADLKAMLGDKADQWEITEIRRGVAGPGEGPRGPDGKLVPLPDVLPQEDGDPAPELSPAPELAPSLSADQAPRLQR